VAYYCVIFISRHYSQKLWTNHERRSAQARAFRENREYVLPARFDDSAIPGIPETIGYIDLRKTKPSAFAAMISHKIGPRKVENYLPPECDLLYKSLGARSLTRKRIVQIQANLFAQTLQRMSLDERRVLLLALCHGCVAGLPDNVHVSIDYLRRCSGFRSRKLSAYWAAWCLLASTASVASTQITNSEAKAKWPISITISAQLVITGATQSM